jgi:beta-phosphoglucomutase family hydrolase
MIKAVIFDMDGVIVDSSHIHIEAEKQTMLKYGIRISSKELHKYTGMTAKFMFTELIKKYKLNTTFEEIFDEKEKFLFKLLEQDTRPTKGVVHLVRKLKQENIKLGVASSAHKRLVEYVLEKLKISHLFDCIVSSEDITHSKPNPEIFLKSANELSVSPTDCLVIEDAKLGVEAAKNAGMQCVGYINPKSGNQDLSEADIVIDDFSKLDIKELF